MTYTPEFSQCVRFDRFNDADFECFYSVDFDANVVYFERVDIDGLILSNRQVAEAWGKSEIERLEDVGQTYWNETGRADEIQAERERNYMEDEE